MRLIVISCIEVLALFALSAHAADRPPEQFRDDYLVLRAGMTEVGKKPLHIGDLLSLIIELDFVTGQVQLEGLDGDFLEQFFVEQQAIDVTRPPDISTVDIGRGTTRVRARWQLQILGCPTEPESCAGAKRYALPALAIGYQITDESGQVLNSKSARFRPWPGSIPIAPAISAPDESTGALTDYFPGGAYPAPASFTGRQPFGLVSMFAGGMLLAIGIGAGVRRRYPTGTRTSVTQVETRWERVYSGLERSGIPDDRWADDLRRCVTWYCLDELGTNPCDWFEHGVLCSDDKEDSTAIVRKFYHDTLQTDCIPSELRTAYLERLAEIVRVRRPIQSRNGTA